MRGGDYLDPALCGLPFDQIEKQPQSRRMDAVVDLSKT